MDEVISRHNGLERDMAKAVRGSKALELTMRDVLNNLSELSYGFAHRPMPEGMEIIAIEAPQPFTPVIPKTTTARIIYLDRYQKLQTTEEEAIATIQDKSAAS